MGIWTGYVETEGQRGAIILDSVDMVPLALPLFADECEADVFLNYARTSGFVDVRRMSPDSLGRLHAAWLAAGKPAHPARLVEVGP